MLSHFKDLMKLEVDKSSSQSQEMIIKLEYTIGRNLLTDAHPGINIYLLSLENLQNFTLMGFMKEIFAVFSHKTLISINKHVSITYT